MKKLLLYLTFIFATFTTSNVIAQNTVITVDATDPALCDGAAFIDTSNVLVYNQIWTGGGAVLQTGGNFINNLCPGTYTLTYTDFLGTTYTYTFTIGTSGSNPCAGFYSMITTNDATDNLTCDGSALVSAYGGSAPYTFLWDNGTTSVSQSNLCIGVYSCYVTDANGCTTSSDGIVNSGLYNTIDSMLIFMNNSYPGNGVIDTLSTTWVEDCTIDYGLVGSASITNYAYLNADTVMVTWTLVDTLGNVVVTYTIPTLITNPVSGVFSATLIVFCAQKNVDINTILVTDQILLDEAQMGIYSVIETPFFIINPFNDVISITLNGNASGSAILFDMNGRKITESTFNRESLLNLNSSTVQTGIYILNLEIDGIVYSSKLIK